MALVYPKEKSPSYKSWLDVNLSTNADGVTGADTFDTGGLAIAAIQPSTLASAACTYTIKGAIDTTTSLGLLFTSSGGAISFGTTAVDPRGSIFAIDPAFTMGIRFGQLVSNTTSAAAPNAAGAQARVFLSAYGQVK